MRTLNLFLPISLAVLTVALVLFIGGEDQQTMAIDGGPAGEAQVITRTVALPATVWNHNATSISPFGIVMYGRVDDKAGLQVMEDAGSKWVTTHLTWSVIEPSRGDYDWSSFDTKAQNAQQAGMDLFVLFTGNPSWAAVLPGGPVTDTQDLVNMVSLMAERYDCDGVDDAEGHPCVHNWSFYAEPDNGDLGRARQGKGYWGHNGAGYAEMLSQVSSNIYGADPNAQVFMGGLAYDWFEEDGGPFVRSFLSDTLAALNSLNGAQAYIDGITFHFYPLNGDDWPTIREKSAEIQGIMTNFGVGDLPLICPETGYWSSPSHGSSEEAQAHWLVQMFVRGGSVDIQSLSWYKVFDAAVPGTAEDKYPDRTSGLLRVDGSFKPSYHAYQTLTRELGGMCYRELFEATGIEGYVFQLPSGQEKTVLWSQSGWAHVTFPYPHLRLVNTLGEEFDIWDNQPGFPGDEDGGIVGQIELAIHDNQPFYVEQQ